MAFSLGGALAVANPLSLIGTALAGGTQLYGIHQAGLSAAADRSAGWNANLLNAWMQGQSNSLNERLMRESWAREDTAVQRRVADLKAAGLSPVLAAGSAAQSSGPIQTTAPRFENVSNRLQQSQQVMGMLQNVAQTITGAMAGYHQVRLMDANATTAEAKSALAKAFAKSELEEIRQRTSESKGRQYYTWEQARQAKSEADYMRDKKRRMPQEGGLSKDLQDMLRIMLGKDKEINDLIPDELKDSISGRSFQKAVEEDKRK
nr:MAG: DNA pilot protein [Microvirus sp.]